MKWKIHPSTLKPGVQVTSDEFGLRLIKRPQLPCLLRISKLMTEINLYESSQEWLFQCTVQKLVVVITSLETNEVLERWQFDIECDKTATENSTPREKSIKVIQDEIRSVIRQITASVTFLPLLETACAFDLLIYTDKDLEVPEKWEESGPQMVNNSEEVRLRSFTTTIHKVNSMVAYKKIDTI
ncbi:MD2L1 protein, partial [Polypterus senegalus]|nr:MD2L1 protein [Polypterus senegalus]